MKLSINAVLASALLLSATPAAIAAQTAEETARIDASSQPAAGEPTLAEIRAATAKYQDAKAAMADGYIRDPANACETAVHVGRAAEEGGMGLHFFRPDLLGITASPNPKVDGSGTYTDFRKPAVLVYEPQADGALQLVAVENLVFEKAWKDAGHDGPPTFHGQPWDRMSDDPNTPVDEAHGFAPHFDRHVWLYRENPNGLFAAFNPQVRCPAH